MTLTQILPSLRRTIPDPISRDRWPEFTTAGLSDIVIAGVSMHRLVEWCDTPCVHTAAAVIPRSNGKPSPSRLTSVIATRIDSVTTEGEHPCLSLDADLGHCQPALGEIRLIGRISTARAVEFDIRAGSERQVVLLPGDLRRGDILVVPCGGATCLHEVRPARAHKD